MSEGRVMEKTDWYMPDVLPVRGGNYERLALLDYAANAVVAVWDEYTCEGWRFFPNSPMPWRGLTGPA